MTDRTDLDDRYIVPGLVRGLQLLETFSADRQELSLAELSRALDVSRSSAFRLVYTLVDLGYLQRDEQTKSYRLGSRVLNLGFAWLASQELLEIARPRLAQLRDLTGCAAHLGILEGREVVYLLRLPAQRALTSNIHVGTRIPAHASSMGRILLAHLPPDQVTRLYESAEMEAVTDQTVTSLPALRRRLSTDRVAGCVISHSAFEAGIASVAVALFDASGGPVGAINISTPEANVTAADLKSWIREAVVDAAAEISSWLGYHPARQSA